MLVRNDFMKASLSRSCDVCWGGKKAGKVETVNSMWSNWNDNCEAKSEAKSPRPLRGLQVDSSLTRNVSYAVR